MLGDAHNAAGVCASADSCVGGVAVFRVALADDAADVVAVTAMDGAGVVTVADGAVGFVQSHHTADIEVAGLVSLFDVDATGVEATQGAGQVAADAAEVTAVFAG